MTRRDLLAFAVGLMLLAGCASTRESEPIAKELDINTPKLLRGEKSYMHYCDKCHPGGERGLGPAIRNKPLPGLLIRLQVRTGIGAMPAFTDDLLPDDQLGDILAYIKLMRKG